MKDARPYWRRMMRPQGNNDGFTLIELVMAIVLGALISGVIVAAIVTSLNIADSTSAQVKDSTDASLISAFLYRDAQAAGGTDPNQAQLDATLGVSTTDAGTCGVPAGSTLVVRFKWLDRQTVSAKRVMLATYSFNSSTKQLTRRICQDLVSSDSILGRALNTASATCSPACTGLPSYVTLAMAGSGTRSTFSYSLSASLRPQTQVRPTTGTASTVTLLALGGAASSCPNLSTAGTSTITALGDVTVASECATSPAMSVAQTISFSGSGSLSTLSGLTDPFVTLTPPSDTCGVGANPAAGTFGTYPNPVTINSAVMFTPGTFVFCNGLTLGAGASITGTGVFLYFKQAGTLTVNTAATVDLTPSSSGAYANILAWLATSGQTVAIASGSQVSSYRGLLYAPTSTVAVSGAGATNIGGIVAKTINFSATGLSTRIGLPIPTIAISPASLSNGEVGVSYTANLSASGGTPLYTWTASGLPAGLSMSAAGVISGTPTTTVGSPFSVTVTALDLTKAAASRTYSLTIVAAPVISCPALPQATQGNYYASNLISGSGGATPYSFTAPLLPGGIVMDAATGALSTQTSVVTASPGLYPVTITLTDALGGISKCSSSINVIASLILPAGFDIQTINTATPGGRTGFMEAGDQIIYTYAGTVKPSLILTNWDGVTNQAVYVRMATGESLPTTMDTVDVFSSSKTPPCIQVGGNLSPLIGDVAVGRIQMGTGIKNKYVKGVGGVVVFNATLSFTSPGTITVTLSTPTSGCANLPNNPNVVAGSMIWTPSGSVATVTESGAPDVDF